MSWSVLTQEFIAEYLKEERLWCVSENKSYADVFNDGYRITFNKSRTSNKRHLNEHVPLASGVFQNVALSALRKKYPYSDIFWSVFSRVISRASSVSLRIQSKFRKIWTKITLNTDTFYAVVKYDHNLTVTELKCIWNKCKNNKTMKTTMHYEIYKIIYHNGSYLLLSGKKRWQNFKNSHK